MKQLSELLSVMPILDHRGSGDGPIRGIAYDSRRVEPGFLFVALRGDRDDGNRYVREALDRGAVAILSDSPLPEDEEGCRPTLGWVQVADARKALALLAAAWFDHPSRSLQLVGVTGTNGKTTVTQLLHGLLDAFGGCGRIGTLGMVRGPHTFPGGLTTPQAPEVQGFLAGCVRDGLKNAVMEVSSVGLDRHRVDELSFKVGVFTSFSGDHLDVHGTMEAYLQAKCRLFRMLGPEGWAVVHGEDDAVSAILSCHEGPYLTYGMGDENDLYPLSYRCSLDGIKATLGTPRGDFRFQSPLLGRINLLNLMAAVGVSQIMGMEDDVIRGVLKSLVGPPGRLERVPGIPVPVVVDYAHTDHALSEMLASIRELVGGRLILVFGAGGDRDRTKRPRMGRVAAKGADLLVVTSDNPRSEDPENIIDGIITGFPTGFDAFYREPDRRKAIRWALAQAGPNDCVVLAGKGHEETQTIGDKVQVFRDAEVALEEWEGLAHG